MFELSRHSLSGQARQVRYVILGLCCAPVVGAYFYNQGYRVQFLVCPVRHWTGIPCPTCGMTRAFMAIVRGDLSQALTEHLLGPFLFLVFVITAAHVALELLTGHRVKAFYEKVLRRRELQLLCLLLAWSYYALRLYYLSNTGELSLAFRHSPLGNLLSSASVAF
jgi:hypothetical protein